MDATINNFVTEVSDVEPSDGTNTENAWQECFDDKSGCPYYWNINTNAVTWEMPLEYKDWLEANKKPNGTLFPSIANNVKVYNIREETNKLSTKLYNIKDNAKIKKRKFDLKKEKKPAPKYKNNGSDSEDEKIILISSYGGDTDSENDNIDDSKKKVETTKPLPHSEVKGVSNTLKEIDKNKVTGFSLLANYGDDSEGEEETVAYEPAESHSTLFPIVKPIDVKQFEEPKVNEYLTKSTDDIDNKAFQRKRRIGINLTNSPKQHRSQSKDEPDDEVEHKGFGFSESNSSKGANNVGLKITFIKSETLNPTLAEERCVDDKEISDAHTSLKEKLMFLSEGKEEVSPVQIMLIQLETLHTALRDGSLKSTYLKKWLMETCEGLVKLEEAAAPSGWLLQWDRAQKRYYYRNKVTDECQWDYPEIEDDAMDICTTPPPPTEEEVSTTPARTPSPLESNTVEPVVESDVAAEEKPPSIASETQPSISEPQEPEPEKPDLNSVLNSFYTDIAEIENTINKKQVQDEVDPVKPKVVEAVIEPPAKKKKKVKVGSLQKKNVSKLVEKWNNVQKDLN